MARVQFGQGVSAIRGRVGGSIFQGGSYGPILKSWNRPTNPRSMAQALSRIHFAQAVRRWRQLSSSAQMAWHTYAAGRYSSDGFLGSYPMTGPTAYAQNAIKLMNWGIPPAQWDLIPGPSGIHPDLQPFVDVQAQYGLNLSPDEIPPLDQLMYSMDALGLIDLNLTILPFVGPNLYAAIVSVIELGDEPVQWNNNNLDLGDYVRTGLGRGITGNGVNEYLLQYDTFDQCTQPLAMFIIRRVTDAESGSRYTASCSDTTHEVSLEHNNDTPQYRGYLGGDLGVIVSGALGSCSLCVASYAQNNLRLYRNNALVGTQAGRSNQVLPHVNLGLLALNTNGSPSGYTNATLQFFATFTAIDEATTQAAIAALEQCHTELTTISA